MTPEDDALIARKPRLSIDDDPFGVVTDWMIEAAARIDALAAENERLTADESASNKALVHANILAGQRAERAEAECERLRKDAERYRFVLPMIGGEDSAEADRRTLLVGAALMKGLTGDAAIDAALAEKGPK